MLRLYAIVAVQKDTGKRRMMKQYTYSRDAGTILPVLYVVTTQLSKFSNTALVWATFSHSL